MPSQESVVDVGEVSEDRRGFKHAILIDGIILQPSLPNPTPRSNATDQKVKVMLSLNNHPLLLPFSIPLLGDLGFGGLSPPASSSGCLLRSLC